jgi:hypothetical protein
MHYVIELEFHCIYWQSEPGGVSSKYSTMQSIKMQGMKGQCLITKQNHKTNSLKPSKLLPHCHQLLKWTKYLESQYSESSLIMCAFLII